MDNNKKKEKEENDVEADPTNRDIKESKKIEEPESKELKEEVVIKKTIKDYEDRITARSTIVSKEDGKDFAAIVSPDSRLPPASKYPIRFEQPISGLENIEFYRRPPSTRLLNMAARAEVRLGVSPNRVAMGNLPPAKNNSVLASVDKDGSGVTYKVIPSIIKVPETRTINHDWMRNVYLGSVDVDHRHELSTDNDLPITPSLAAGILGSVKRASRLAAIAPDGPVVIGNVAFRTEKHIVDPNDPAPPLDSLYFSFGPGDPQIVHPADPSSTMTTMCEAAMVYQLVKQLELPKLIQLAPGFVPATRSTDPMSVTSTLTWMGTSSVVELPITPIVTGRRFLFHYPVPTTVPEAINAVLSSVFIPPLCIANYLTVYTRAMAILVGEESAVNPLLDAGNNPTWDINEATGLTGAIGGNTLGGPRGRALRINRITTACGWGVLPPINMATSNCMLPIAIIGQLLLANTPTWNNGRMVLPPGYARMYADVAGWLSPGRGGAYELARIVKAVLAPNVVTGYWDIVNGIIGSIPRSAGLAGLGVPPPALKAHSLEPEPILLAVAPITAYASYKYRETMVLNAEQKYTYVTNINGVVHAVRLALSLVVTNLSLGLGVNLAANTPIQLNPQMNNPPPCPLFWDVDNPNGKKGFMLRTIEQAWDAFVGKYEFAFSARPLKKFFTSLIFQQLLNVGPAASWLQDASDLSSPLLIGRTLVTQMTSDQVVDPVVAVSSGVPAYTHQGTVFIPRFNPNVPLTRVPTFLDFGVPLRPGADQGGPNRPVGSLIGPILRAPVGLWGLAPIASRLTPERGFAAVWTLPDWETLCMLAPRTALSLTTRGDNFHGTVWAYYRHIAAPIFTDLVNEIVSKLSLREFLGSEVGRRWASVLSTMGKRLPTIDGSEIRVKSSLGFTDTPDIPGAVVYSEVSPYPIPAGFAIPAAVKVRFNWRRTNGFFVRGPPLLPPRTSVGVQPLKKPTMTPAPDGAVIHGTDFYYAVAAGRPYYQDALLRGATGRIPMVGWDNFDPARIVGNQLTILRGGMNHLPVDPFTAGQAEKLVLYYGDVPVPFLYLLEIAYSSSLDLKIEELYDTFFARGTGILVSDDLFQAWFGARPVTIPGLIELAPMKHKKVELLSGSDRKEQQRISLEAPPKLEPDTEVISSRDGFVVPEVRTVEPLSRFPNTVISTASWPKMAFVV